MTDPMRVCEGVAPFGLRDFTTADLREELLRREVPVEGPRLQTPSALAEYMRPFFVGLKREEFHVVGLNGNNRLLVHERIAIGSVDQCHVDPRSVFSPLVVAKATGFVLFHNHPSGDPEPSVQDIALTRQLRDGARLMCLRLLDHIVMGASGGFISMLARGLIKPDQR